MSITSLLRMLERDRDHGGIPSSVRRQEIIAEWNQGLTDLYQKLSHWLQDAVQQSLIQASDDPIEMVERELGAYKSYRLVLRLPSEREIVVEPVGRLVPGTEGRAEMRGESGRVAYSLARIGGDWQIKPFGAGTYHALAPELFYDALEAIIADDSHDDASGAA